MTPRLHLDLPLSAGAEPSLPPGPARHVQVLRLQPGAALVVFDGRGGEWQAEVLEMGRGVVRLRVLAHSAIERELPMAVTLAVGMPANERMDGLVEKATELGAAVVQPLLCERSVLRLAGERAERRMQHWQGVAVAAAEQSGRTRVPVVAPVRTIAAWLRGLASPPAADERRCVLSLREAASLVDTVAPAAGSIVLLSGPEGGLTPDEEAQARACGFAAVSLGPRVLRADTAPLAALAQLAVRAGASAPR